MNNVRPIYVLTHNSPKTSDRIQNLIKSLGHQTIAIESNPYILTHKSAGIVVVDCCSVELTADGMPKQLDVYAQQHQVMLINLTEGTINELVAIERGCVGAIYGDLSQEKFFDAIQAVIQEDYVFSRKSISRALRQVLRQESNGQNATVQGDSSETIGNLTRREKAIVDLVCKGASNNDIAEALYISCHTVKTHIYSAFRKTRCKNRVELIYWAMKNTPNHGLIA